MRTNTGLTNVLFVMLCAVLVNSSLSAQSSSELVAAPEMLAPGDPPVTPPAKPACPTVPNNQALNSNTGQVNALAPGTNWTVQITNTNLTSPQINEIGAALNAWNPVFQSQGITVTIGGVNASDGSNLIGNVILFQQSQATVINGVTYQSAVSWTQTSSNGTIAYPKIAINTSAQSLSPALFTALMVHEIAHMMGIGDCTAASCAQSASQNGTVSYQPQPYATAPTSCDQAAVTNAYNMIKNNQNPSGQGSSTGKAGGGDGGECNGDPPNDTCLCDVTTGLWSSCLCDGSTPVCPDGTAAVCVDGSFTCGTVTTDQCVGAAPTCPSGQDAACVGTTWQCQAAPGACTSDGDCPGGYVCLGGVCGCSSACDDPSCPGYSCDNCGANCGGGCYSDGDCAGGLVCMGGVCGCSSICDDPSCDANYTCDCTSACDGGGGDGGGGGGGGGSCYFDGCYWWCD